MFIGSYKCKQIHFSFKCKYYKNVLYHILGVLDFTEVLFQMPPPQMMEACQNAISPIKSGC